MNKFLKWLLIAIMPFFLAFNLITLIINPLYFESEYAKPDFPLDPFGLTQGQRGVLAGVVFDYLERWGSAETTIHLLEDARLPDGAPLFNSREITHMIDVKDLTNPVRLLGFAAAAVMIGGLLWLRKSKEGKAVIPQILFGGGLFTTLFLGSIGLFIAVAWDVFFVTFHGLFFKGGTWTFAYSDGLIRLFPEVFFLDIGILMVGSILVAGLLVMAWGYTMKRKAISSRRTLKPKRKR